MSEKKQVRAAIYARCSTLDKGQNPELQAHELRLFVERRGWELTAEYVDHGVSGAKDRRPAIDKLMRAARARKIDAVVVWKFDRFARSTRHLVTALDEFRDLGVDFISITEAVDTSTPMGRVVFTIIASMAEFERSLIRERVRLGVAKAKADGKRLGRPPVEVDQGQVLELRAAGLSLREIARRLGVGKNVVSRVLTACPESGAAHA